MSRFASMDKESYEDSSKDHRGIVLRVGMNVQQKRKNKMTGTICWTPEGRLTQDMLDDHIEGEAIYRQLVD